MIKILTIIGARPQIIKAAAISRAIKNHFSSYINEIIVHTGQHYDENMSDVFFTQLEVPREKYNLKTGSGNHAVQTARMMEEIDKVIAIEQPQAVLLYGDTNSTLAACLVAIKIHLPVIHIEAGVRSYNKSFPEEVNRLICDHMSTLLFVPSEAGMLGLKKEGFDLQGNPTKASADAPKVFRCGDIMYDNTIFFMNKVDQMENNVFTRLGLPQNNYVLATMHRPSNVDDVLNLENILKAFIQVAENHDKQVIVPLHPRTKNIITQHKGLHHLLSHTKLKPIPAVSFLDMVQLEKKADLIITDSGGVQKEAYFMKKPCLIMLEETPWVELVETGNAILTGSDPNKILTGAAHFLSKNKNLDFPGLYGDGKAAEFICQKIVEHFRN